MKIVFAPDKFKMCMKSATVCRVLQNAFRTVMPDAELVSVPVSDGGEGMTRALADALHGKHEGILLAMQELREAVDALEKQIPDACWPLPKYREMLFIY